MRKYPPGQPLADSISIKQPKSGTLPQGSPSTSMNNQDYVFVAEADCYIRRSSVSAIHAVHVAALGVHRVQIVMLPAVTPTPVPVTLVFGHSMWPSSVKDLVSKLKKDLNIP